MAIRDIVTRGYGNGTYSGTIAKVVTRGYSIGEAVATVDGPGCFVMGQVYHPGFKEGDEYKPGFQEGEANC